MRKRVWCWERQERKADIEHNHTTIVIFETDYGGHCDFKGQEINIKKGENAVGEGVSPRGSIFT